jgi:hypothetical protein
VLVEPILACSLLLSLFLGRAINRRHVGRTGWTAAVVLAIGVSLFLSLVAPTKGINIAPTRSWLIAAPAIAAFVLLCIVLARSATGTNRAVFLGLAAGTLFGTSAVLTKAFVHYLGGGVFNWVPHWEPCALAVSSITGPRARTNVSDRRARRRDRRRAGDAAVERRGAGRRSPRRAPRHLGRVRDPSR